MKSEGTELYADVGVLAPTQVHSMSLVLGLLYICLVRWGGKLVRSHEQTQRVMLMGEHFIGYTFYHLYPAVT